MADFISSCQCLCSLTTTTLFPTTISPHFLPVKVLASSQSDQVVGVVYLKRFVSALVVVGRPNALRFGGGSRPNLSGPKGFSLRGA